MESDKKEGPTPPHVAGGDGSRPQLRLLRCSGAREERGGVRCGGFSTKEVRTDTPKRTRSVKVSEMCEISG